MRDVDVSPFEAFIIDTALRGATSPEQIRARVEALHKLFAFIAGEGA